MHTTIKSLKFLKLISIVAKNAYLNWFRLNEMVPNQGKCHLMVADINHTHYDSKSFIYLENAFLESEEVVKLLGIFIDKSLTFEKHINSILKKCK